MTMPDGCGLLIAVGLLLGFAFIFGTLVAGPAPAPVALRAEAWTPCEAPRPDVECWRSGHTIVCLPLTPEHPRNDQ